MDGEDSGLYAPSRGERYGLPAELEDLRLRSLEQIQAVYDADGRFVPITQMARSVFGVPMAAVSLIDRDRQLFLAADGLALGESVNRSDTVCQAVIARSYEQPEPSALVLDDASSDPEFADVRGIGDGGIKFYAGHPLYGPGGHAVGTFCIYDTVPRTLDSAQLDTFSQLAAWVQRELQSSEHLDRAAAVQRQLLPRAIGDLPGYTVRAVCIPAFAVGGDFYDHHSGPDGLTITVADVMGKGMGAAILAASVRSALRAASSAAGGDPAGAVNAVAAQLVDDLSETASFVTLFHAHLDVASGVVRYVDAGHGLAAIVRADGSAEHLKGAGLPLGVTSDARWDSGSVVLGAGDTLIAASDGALDLLGGELHTGDALDFLRAHPDPDELCSVLEAEVSGRTPLDDVTVIAIRREG